MIVPRSLRHDGAGAVRRHRGAVIVPRSSWHDLIGPVRRDGGPVIVPRSPWHDDFHAGAPRFVARDVPDSLHRDNQVVGRGGERAD